MGYKVAIVGATGNVGREMLGILAERAFPADEVVALASRRSQGTEVSFGDKILKVKALDLYDFSDTDICLMSAGGTWPSTTTPRTIAVWQERRSSGTPRAVFTAAMLGLLTTVTLTPNAASIRFAQSTQQPQPGSRHMVMLFA